MEWYKISELLNLVFRWFHILAGISWIGQTYLFNWMERTLPLEVDSDADENISGQLWMVHGGGFYLVEKQTKPKVMPRTLHWFKWESALTWISGFFLLIIIYYMGGLMLEPDSEMSELTACLIGISVLVFGFGIYHLLWSSLIGKNEYVGAAISLILIIGLFVGLDQIFSSRAAMMHIGALFGTIMAANVWMIILPNQRKMITAVENNQQPDMLLAVKAKTCSKHNTFMSVPVIFIMISSHFPVTTYGNTDNWLMLGIFILIGWAGAKWMRG
ncbi:MAG: urate hydroxylase PuuD [Candidatus Marinimicrobia bacterium]|nr:urate hydroxylase PuuD [Candidatus Neomarinimicrobiota bacterium]